MDLEFTLVVNVAGEDTAKVRDDVRRTVEQTLGVAADATTRRSSGPIWVTYLVTPRAPRAKTGCPYPMTPDEYVAAGGGQCPNCGDPQTNVEYRSVDFEGGGVYQRADCGACGFSWFDKYHLAGFEVLVAPCEICYGEHGPAVTDCPMYRPIPCKVCGAETFGQWAAHCVDCGATVCVTCTNEGKHSPCPERS